MVIFQEGDKLVLSERGRKFFAVCSSYILDRGPATFERYVNDRPGYIQFKTEGDWSNFGNWTSAYFELQESNGPW